MVKLNVHTGCCAAYNFYDIGSAHGIQRAKDIEDFVSRFDNFGPNTMNTIFLNSGQTVERRWLLELGWVLSAQYGTISLFTISRSGFNQFKSKFHAIREKKAAEERALREKERAEAQKKEQEERMSPERIKRRREIFEVRVRDRKLRDYKGSVTNDYIARTLGTQWIEKHHLDHFEKVFGVKFKRPLEYYTNRYKLYESLKSLIAHKKKREREAERIKNGTTG